MINNLSVFFPAFNEEENIEKTLNDALKVLDGLNLKNYEIIVVDDGSKDKTVSIVKELSKENPKVRLVEHKSNQGYGNALKTGFKEAKYEWIAFADSDGQFDFSEITKFLEEADNADFVLGYRIKRADSVLRTFFTWVWKMVAKILLGLSAKDYSCGFKLIKRESYKKTLPLIAGEKVTQIEMLVKANRLGFRFAEVGVHHYPRKFGTQTGADLKVVIKSLFDLIKLWWKLLKKIEFAAIITIILLAAFFRIYKIDQYMTFLGDEGRDALMIKRILTTGDLPLIGPPTSIGNIYLGPLYYYMMTLPMAIFWLNPVSAAVQVAIIGTATVFLIYYLGKIWFGIKAGLLAAFLYAISPITIFYSRSSWNPNPTPFFALLGVLGFYKAHKSGNLRWLILVGAALAFAVQMHYLALILLPIFGILWLYEVTLILRKKVNSVHMMSGTLCAILVFLALMSPLFVFDLKHNFLNYRAITEFFLNRETTVNLNPLNTIERIIPIYNHNLVGRYIGGENPWITPLVSFLILSPLVIALWMRFRSRPLRWVYLALGVWLTVGILGLALYKQNIFDHYLGFLNPVPYLLLGSILCYTSDVVHKLRWIFWVGVFGILITLTFLNLDKNPLKFPPNNQLEKTQNIAKFIIIEAGGKPFNFALIAKNNYDAAYQFYLDFYGHKPKIVPIEITEQLFIVCEDPICEPINHPKQEIAHFGWAKIEKENEFGGIRVFKLVHNPSGKP